MKTARQIGLRLPRQRKTWMQSLATPRNIEMCSQWDTLRETFHRVHRIQRKNNGYVLFYGWQWKATVIFMVFPVIRREPYEHL